MKRLIKEEYKKLNEVVKSYKGTIENLMNQGVMSKEDPLFSILILYPKWKKVIIEIKNGKILYNKIKKTKLNLRNKNITELSEEIGNLTNLTELILFDNQLRNLPIEISDLINLTFLNLAGNRLECLPSEIEFLTKLTELHLYQNPMDMNELEEIESWLPNCDVVY